MFESCDVRLLHQKQSELAALPDTEWGLQYLRLRLCLGDPLMFFAIVHSTSFWWILCLFASLDFLEKTWYSTGTNGKWEYFGTEITQKSTLWKIGQAVYLPEITSPSKSWLASLTIKGILTSKRFKFGKKSKRHYIIWACHIFLEKLTFGHGLFAHNARSPFSVELADVFAGAARTSHNWWKTLKWTTWVIIPKSNKELKYSYGKSEEKYSWCTYK